MELLHGGMLFSPLKITLLSQLTAAVMTMGEMKFKQKGRDEQCEPDKLDFFRKVHLKNIISYIDNIFLIGSHSDGC